MKYYLYKDPNEEIIKKKYIEIITKCDKVDSGFKNYIQNKNNIKVVYNYANVADLTYDGIWVTLEYTCDISYVSGYRYSDFDGRITSETNDTTETRREDIFLEKDMIKGEYKCGYLSTTRGAIVEEKQYNELPDDVRNYINSNVKLENIIKIFLNSSSSVIENPIRLGLTEDAKLRINNYLKNKNSDAKKIKSLFIKRFYEPKNPTLSSVSIYKRTMIEVDYKDKSYYVSANDILDFREDKFNKDIERKVLVTEECRNEINIDKRKRKRKYLYAVIIPLIAYIVGLAWFWSKRGISFSTLMNYEEAFIWSIECTLMLIFAIVICLNAANDDYYKDKYHLFSKSLLLDLVFLVYFALIPNLLPDGLVTTITSLPNIFIFMLFIYSVIQIKRKY